MYYTDDPIADFERWDRARAEEERKFPRCCECDEHIVDEYAYYINGVWVHEECVNLCRRQVDLDL